MDFLSILNSDTAAGVNLGHQQLPTAQQAPVPSAPDGLKVSRPHTLATLPARFLDFMNQKQGEWRKEQALKGAMQERILQALLGPTAQPQGKTPEQGMTQNIPMQPLSTAIPQRPVNHSFNFNSAPPIL